MIGIGLDVASAGSVDCRVSVSSDRPRKDGPVGLMEYLRGPQKLTPSVFPLVKLAESVARTVYTSAPKFTYASMSLTGAKLIDVLAQGSMTSIEKVNDSIMFTPEPGYVSYGIVAVTVTEYVPASPVFVVSI